MADRVAALLTLLCFLALQGIVGADDDDSIDIPTIAQELTFRCANDLA